MDVNADFMAVLPRRRALRFIILLGIVSLFADMTYESARGITGPYLAFLGASATIVGLISGFGELLGYAFRLVSGYFADRTGRYWPITIFGYVLNLLAVPALALTGRWELAALLIIAERMGKAIRAPARDAMLSHAARQTGLGWGFGLHEAMDQMGAIAGPLMLSAVLVSGHGYREAFGVLLAPAILSLALLLVARYLFPRPQDLDLAPEWLEAKGLRSAFWLYMLAIAFIAAGYADYALIAFHFDRSGVVPTAWIPLLYAIAMATDAIAALVLGRAFDRVGLWAMIVATLASAAAAPLVFLGDLRVAAVGMALWGLGMGAQESVMRAAVAAMAPKEKLGTAFGTMNTIYGVAWFGGSALLGILYDRTSPSSVALVSAGLQLAAIPVFLLLIDRREV